MDDQIDVVLCLDGLSSVKIKAFQQGRPLSGFSTTISGELRRLLKQVYSSESLETGVLEYLEKRGTCTVRIEHQRQFFKAKWEPNKRITAVPQLSYSSPEGTVSAAYYAQGLGDIQDTIRLGEKLFFDKWRGELLQMHVDAEWNHKQWRQSEFVEKAMWGYACNTPKFAFMFTQDGHECVPTATEMGALHVNLYRQKESLCVDFFIVQGPLRVPIVMDKIIGEEDGQKIAKTVFLPFPIDTGWHYLEISGDSLLACIDACEKADPRMTMDTHGVVFSWGISREAERDLVAAFSACNIAVHIQDMPTTLENWDVTIDMREVPDIRVFRGRIRIEESLWEEAIRQDGQVVDATRLVLLREEARAALAAVSKWRQLKEKVAKGHVWHPLLQWVYLRQNGVNLILPKEQEETVQALMSFSHIPDVTVPDFFCANLRGYQSEAVRWLCFLYGLKLGACLADDMGLGKTVQTLAFVAAVRAKDPKARVMIVVPPSLVHHWVAEWRRFLPDVPIMAVTGKESGPVDLACITSYETVRRQPIFFAGQWQIVVFDEAHWVKNPTAQRADAVRRLQADFRVCLTGTPLENHLGEFVAVMETAVPGLFFGGNVSKSGPEQDWVRAAKPFLLRRTKAQMLPELPEKLESDVILEMAEDQQAAYDAIREEARQKITDAYASMAKHRAGVVALTALLRLRQICVSPALVYKGQSESVKFDYLTGQLEMVLDEGHSCLVFSQFRQSLILLEAKLKKMGIASVRIDGTTPGTQRQAIVDAFQKSEVPQVLLMSLKTGGVGFHLTRASVVFHLDPWWNPAVEDQATDRTYRLGQDKAVNVYRLLIKNSIEERIQILKQQKQKVFSSVVESGGMDRVAALTYEDFMFVLG